MSMADKLYGAQKTLKRMQRVVAGLREQLAIHEESTRLLGQLAEMTLGRVKNDDGEYVGVLAVSETHKDVVQQLGACGLVDVTTEHPGEVVGYWRDEE